MPAARGEEAVRIAFRSQAEYCRKLGSAFTAALCDLLADGLTRDTPAGRAVLEWSGDPAPLADSVSLRVTGALHAIARSGRAPYLRAMYPPSAPQPSSLEHAVLRAFADESAFIERFVQSPPQTNEVGRAAALIAGWLEIAQQTALPLAIYEIGASAGLNLIADRYQYRFGSARLGHADARPLLEPEWSGSPPPVDTPLRIASRRGCDLQPVDVRNAEARERLIAYVWPDQPERLARLIAAIETAAADPPAIDAMDAADWVEWQLSDGVTPGVARVLCHSVTWMYLSSNTQNRIADRLATLGSRATTDSPLAWLRLEPQPATGLRLTTWPGGQERLLADAHPHGAWVRWNGSAAPANVGR